MATVDDQIKSQADYLDALARAVREINQWRAGLAAAELEGRLSSDFALSPVPSSLAGQMSPSGPAYSLGNVQPWVGQANVLLDPTFETVYSAGEIAIPSGSTPTPNGQWSSHYVLNSGALPSGHGIERFYRRGEPDANPYNSAVVFVDLSGFTTSATDLAFYVYPGVDFHPAGPALPYLVASVRVHIGNAPDSILDVAAVELEIWNATSSAVVATSQRLNLKTVGLLDPAQLVVPWPNTPAVFHAANWRWRLRVLATKGVTGFGGGGIGLYIAEPQLHFAYTPDPMPFVPAVANWSPTTLPAAVQSLIATSTITPPPLGRGVVQPISASGAITMTSAPTISNGIDGQEIILYNGAANNITLQDQGTLAGSNLRLVAPSVTLGPRNSVRLMFLTTIVGDWVQIGPVVNVL